MAISWLQACGIPAKMKEDVMKTFQGNTIKNIFEREDNITNVRSSKTQDREALSLSHLIPPFLFIVTGLLISLIAFCVEKCLERAKKRPLNHNRWAIMTENVIVI